MRWHFLLHGMCSSESLRAVRGKNPQMEKKLVFGFDLWMKEGLCLARMKNLLIAFLSLVLTGTAFSGGSVMTTEVQEIRKQEPALWEYLNTTLDFAEVATGLRCDNVWEHMSGARLAPYKVAVKPKGEEGDFSMVLVVECQQHFLDKDGKEIDFEDTDNRFRRTVKIEETLLHVKLLPASRKELIR